jgi:hypothetical protein
MGYLRHNDKSRVRNITRFRLNPARQRSSEQQQHFFFVVGHTIQLDIFCLRFHLFQVGCDLHQEMHMLQSTLILYWKCSLHDIKDLLKITDFRPDKECQQHERKLEFMKIVITAWLRLVLVRFHDDCSTPEPSARDYCTSFLEWCNKQVSQDKEFARWHVLVFQMYVPLLMFHESIRFNDYETWFVVQKKWIPVFATTKKHVYAHAGMYTCLARHLRSHRRNVILMQHLSFSQSGREGKNVANDYLQERMVDKVKSGISPATSKQGLETLIRRLSFNVNFCEQVRRVVERNWAGMARTQKQTSKPTIEREISLVMEILKVSGSSDTEPTRNQSAVYPVAIAASAVKVPFSEQVRDEMEHKLWFALVDGFPLVMEYNGMQTLCGTSDTFQKGCVLIGIYDASGQFHRARFGKCRVYECILSHFDLSRVPGSPYFVETSDPTFALLKINEKEVASLTETEFDDLASSDEVVVVSKAKLASLRDIFSDLAVGPAVIVIGRNGSQHSSLFASCTNETSVTLDVDDSVPSDSQLSNLMRIIEHRHAVTLKSEKETMRKTTKMPSGKKYQSPDLDPLIFTKPLRTSQTNVFKSFSSKQQQRDSKRKFMLDMLSGRTQYGQPRPDYNCTGQKKQKISQTLHDDAVLSPEDLALTKTQLATCQQDLHNLLHLLQLAKREEINCYSDRAARTDPNNVSVNLCKQKILFLKHRLDACTAKQTSLRDKLVLHKSAQMRKAVVEDCFVDSLMDDVAETETQQTVSVIEATCTLEELHDDSDSLSGTEEEYVDESVREDECLHELSS